MSAPPELIPLQCVRCAMPIKAKDGEAAWLCGECGQGQALDESVGLVPLSLFFSSELRVQAVGRPFWVATGSVHIDRRKYPGYGSGSVASEAFWSVPHRFFIPAYYCSLDEMVQLALGALTQPPNTVQGPITPFRPVVLSRDDVLSVVEFVVVAVEAERQDKVKRLAFQVDMESPTLWVLP